MLRARQVFIQLLNNKIKRAPNILRPKLYSTHKSTQARIIYKLFLYV